MRERSSHSGGGKSATARDLDIVSIPLKLPNISQRDFSDDDEECEIINSKYLVYWPKYSQDSYNQKVSFPKRSLYGHLSSCVLCECEPLTPKCPGNPEGEVNFTRKTNLLSN